MSANVGMHGPHESCLCCMQSCAHTHTHTQTDRHRRTQTDRQRHRQTHRDTDRQTETGMQAGTDARTHQMQNDERKRTACLQPGALCLLTAFLLPVHILYSFPPDMLLHYLHHFSVISMRDQAFYLLLMWSHLSNTRSCASAVKYHCLL